jgi:hypothetical protein
MAHRHTDEDDEIGGYAVLPKFLKLDATRTVDVEEATLSQWREAANYARLTGGKCARLLAYVAFDTAKRLNLRDGEPLLPQTKGEPL